MKKELLVNIAKKLAVYDRTDTSFYEGAFSALVCLLCDFGYSYVRRNGQMCILNRKCELVCSVSLY